MFKRRYEEILDSQVRWRRCEDNPLHYVEAKQAISGHQLCSGEINTERELKVWLQEQAGIRKGKICLLMCERLGWEPLDFSMSKDAFESMMKTFGLPLETLQAFQSHNGTHFCRSRYSGVKLVSIGIVVKLPQMFQLGNCGLSLTHSYETGTTNAFLWGWNVLRKTNYVTNKPVEPHCAAFGTALQCMASSWTDPLLLPMVLLSDYIDRAVKFLKEDISRCMTTIDRRLGVTRTGRHYKSDENAFELDEILRVMSKRKVRARFTSELHTNAHNAIALSHHLQWSRRYGEFLRDTANDDKTGTRKQDSDVQEAIAYLQSSLDGVIDYVAQVRDRQDLQLSVLNSFIDQADNDQSMKVARDARVDGLAMKALALVTAVFLPPSFIATMFSMSMFDWQAKSSDVVSSNFWIYWAASLPLAALLLIGWRVWWGRQRRVYEEEYQQGWMGWDRLKEKSLQSSGRMGMLPRVRV